MRYWNILIIRQTTECPKFIGCKVDLLRLRFEKRFKMDFDELENLMTDKTTLVSLTHPNNPIGSMISEKTLKDIHQARGVS
ncbi:MAG: aminotransferase class I/II-fold pyridoxal phosphate-dependent enzyme [Candidatus Bathycorpusculaceae bacterium]